MSELCSQSDGASGSISAVLIKVELDAGHRCVAAQPFDPFESQLDVGESGIDSGQLRLDLKSAPLLVGKQRIEIHHRSGRG